MLNQVLSYREMCDAEGAQTLQRGMNYRLNPQYSVILMSQRANAPYRDRALADGRTVEYQGHDEPRIGGADPKQLDQPKATKVGRLTQNGLFIKAVEQYQAGIAPAEPVKVYEKVLNGVWSFKGLFELAGYEGRYDGHRKVFVFLLKLSQGQEFGDTIVVDLRHTRMIPAEVKKEVWKRDQGRCVKCGSATNLHFDHDLPFSLGGTSLTANNVRLLCAKHNLSKSNKIE